VTVETENIQKLKTALAPFSQLSRLKKKTATESAGPCPICGGEDRFFVCGDKGFCRGCNIKGGDIIDWHRRIDGIDLAGQLPLRLLWSLIILNPFRVAELTRLAEMACKCGQASQETMPRHPVKAGRKPNRKMAFL
jgi:hypothetical protein